LLACTLGELTGGCCELRRKLLTCVRLLKGGCLGIWGCPQRGPTWRGCQQFYWHRGRGPLWTLPNFSLIPAILGHSYSSEVTNAVISPVMVDVVYGKRIGVFPVVECPSYAMET